MLTLLANIMGTLVSWMLILVGVGGLLLLVGALVGILV